MLNFSLPQGTNLCRNQYQIVKVLGKGGFGITYLANFLQNETENPKQVVIKECFLSGICVRNQDLSVNVVAIEADEFIRYKEKFLQEATLLHKLQNTPHIISVIDFFEEHNTAYLVMSYETEETLEIYCQKQNNQRLTEPETLTYAFQLTQALKTLHQLNILHQDIKPSNILRKSSGEVLLIDFGTAKEWILSSRSKTLTANAIISPGYAPPEAYNPSAIKGTYSDVYGLAATLYRLLTGITPLDATSRSIEELKAISDYVVVSSTIENAVMRALSLKPTQRFDTIEAFEKALKGEIIVEKNPIFGSETINFQLLKKQAEAFFEQKKYEEALQVYETLGLHFPKEKSIDQRIEVIQTLISKQQQTHKTYQWLGYGFIMLLAIVGVYKWQKKTPTSEKNTNAIAQTDTNITHISEADTTPPILPEISPNQSEKLKDSLVNLPKIDSVTYRKKLAQQQIRKADSAMKSKNFQLAQQFWMEAAALTPQNKMIKQKMRVCEQEIQKELSKQMQPIAQNSLPNKTNSQPISPSNTDISVQRTTKIIGLKDAEGQVFDYEGESLDGKPYGKGKLMYQNGSVCEGTMQNGGLNGSCICSFYNGDRYIGNVKNDRREGRGIYFYTHLGARYIGEWLNDKQHGNGTWYYDNGDKYEALFQNGHPVGKIKFTYHTGETIIGKWENGKFTKE